MSKDRDDLLSLIEGTLRNIEGLKRSVGIGEDMPGVDKRHTESVDDFKERVEERYKKET